MIKDIEEELAYGELDCYMCGGKADVEYLLSIVKKQREALETVLENIGNGEDSFSVVVEALKEG